MILPVAPTRLHPAVELRTAGLTRGSRLNCRFGGNSVETKFARVGKYAPKRLPSRRWAIAYRFNVPRPFEDADD